MPEVATVTYKGQITTATVTGETLVKAADSKNLAHFDTMQVENIFHESEKSQTFIWLLAVFIFSFFFYHKRFY